MLELASPNDPMLLQLAAALRGSLHDVGMHAHPEDAAREAARILADDARDRGNTSEADHFRLPLSAGQGGTSTSPSRDATDVEALLEAMIAEDIMVHKSSLTGAQVISHWCQRQNTDPAVAAWCPISSLQDQQTHA